ncbi:hypothetical protein BY996DRAFT_4588022 [Phakopsora pachyrhizi]|uniref:Uncharacterized protein n=1 Tax=Phakopsora pachyrhizi TaxID=170000 RepID=A0AAV0B5T8_PHAPC|nr:hypothetical protein BY996DRAFT_4588022 [Phakopsora pachyrhizi]CAH7682461.1 hypothetical protein PPACK8108_LOCUS15390 [Phakopsora pachyrhizi]
MQHLGLIGQKNLKKKNRLSSFEVPNVYNVRAKPRTVDLLTKTKDLQMVNIKCCVLSCLNIKALLIIY